MKCKVYPVQPTWMLGLNIEGTRIYLLVSEHECRDLARGEVPAEVRTQARDALEALGETASSEASTVESQGTLPDVRS